MRARLSSVWCGVQYTVGALCGKLLLVGLAGALSGCTTIGYYGQAVQGQWQVMSARRPVSRLIAAEETDPALRERLGVARDILSFAESDLALPVGRRYSRYADIGREDVVYNVVAAPELSLEARRWCYPIVGCAPYRGFFKRRKAEKLAAELREIGLEVSVTGAAAYSTLGWFNDPLLNTFIGWHDGALASLLIHELAHSRVWIRGDVRLNESFAGFVGRRGAEAWLVDRPQALARFRRDALDHLAFRRWSQALRQALAGVYGSEDTDSVKRQRKAEVMARYRSCYEANRAHFGRGRYDRSVASINNAWLALMTTYGSYDVAFDRLFDDADGSWPLFYDAVGELADLQRPERRRRLAELASGDEGVAAERDDHGAGEVQCETFSRHPVGGEASG